MLIVKLTLFFSFFKLTPLGIETLAYNCILLFFILYPKELKIFF